MIPLNDQMLLQKKKIGELHELHIDSNRHKELGKFEKELGQEEPMKMFVRIESSLNEVMDIVKESESVCNTRSQCVQEMP